MHADFSLMEITGFWFFFLIVIVFPTVFEFVIGVIQIEPGGVETETDQTGYRFFMKIKSPADGESCSEITFERLIHTEVRSRFEFLLYKTQIAVLFT